MTMKNSIPLAIALLCLTSCWESNGGGDLDHLVDLSPEICTTFCRELSECQLGTIGYGGELADELMAGEIEQCSISCGTKLSEGTYVIRRDYDPEPDVYEYLEHIDGDTLAAYFQCLTDTGFYGCSELGYYALAVESESDCDEVAKCWEIIDSDYLSELVWLEHDLTGATNCTANDTDEGTRTYLDFWFDLLRQSSLF